MSPRGVGFEGFHRNRVLICCISLDPALHHAYAHPLRVLQSHNCPCLNTRTTPAPLHLAPMHQPTKPLVGQRHPLAHIVPTTNAEHHQCWPPPPVPLPPLPPFPPPLSSVLLSRRPFSPGLPPFAPTYCSTASSQTSPSTTCPPHSSPSHHTAAASSQQPVAAVAAAAAPLLLLLLLNAGCLVASA